MANSFEIKYLFELYPDTDFTELFVTEQTITETMPDYISQATTNAWSHILDSIHAKRLIQTYKKRFYECEIKLSRNLDVARLAVGYVTLTTTDSETFAIYDVSTTFEKIEGSLNYLLKLSFFRYDDDIINHLSSVNAYNLTQLGSPIDVNELGYDVDNPSYAFNNITTYLYEFSPGADAQAFKVPFNDLTNTIAVNDIYYLHTNNPTFDALQDISHEYLSYAECYAKDANYVYFQCSNDEMSAATLYTLNNVVIDHEPDHRALPSGISVADKTISLVIYTFINPKISDIDTPELYTTPNGITENQKFNHKKKASFKVWVTTAELYKIEFLNYALFNDITLTLADTTVYTPCQVGEIYKKVDKEMLIDLHEFDIDILYKNKTVNINR